MGIFKGTLLAIASLAAIGAAAQEEVIVTPMNETEPMVLLEKSVSALKEQIANAKNLDPAVRVQTAQDLDRQADEMRVQVGEISRSIAILGKNVFVAGLMVTYQGEYNFQSPWAAVTANPSAEYGVAVFLKKNEEFVSSSIRGAFVGIAGIGADLNAGRGAVVRATGAEKGWRLKVLISRSGAQEANVRGVNLLDFEGGWTGLGGDAALFGRDLGAAVYTKLNTCENLLPTSCSTYIFAFQGPTNGSQGASIGAKQIFLDFNVDANGEGFGF